MFSKGAINIFKPSAKESIGLRIIITFESWPVYQEITNCTLIVAPIPDEVGDGGSTINSGIGERNLYL